MKISEYIMFLARITAHFPIQEIKIYAQEIKLPLNLEGD